MRRVAVEDDLTPYQEAIAEAGYEVIRLSEAESLFDEVDAVVVSGEDEDILGDESVLFDMPVISVEGMTPEEVVARLEETFEL